MRLMNLKSTLDTVGAEDFNANFKGATLCGQFDSHNRSGSNGDAGFLHQAEYVKAGQQVAVKGRLAVAGKEFTRFDPNNDKLRPGEVRYFERPGDTESAVQGWNVIYLGTDDSGKPKFWRVRDGVEAVKLQDNFDATEGGAYSGEYLSSQRATPDVASLIAIDRSANDR